MGQYRLQLPPEALWTPWRQLTQAPTEELVLCIECKDCTLEEKLAFLTQYFTGGLDADSP